ncbi:RRM domain-containing protein [Aphelenchoides fujianensis]|nr:RRM domain-containing protein [Aphelenchoides fujianensis]
MNEEDLLADGKGDYAVTEEDEHILLGVKEEAEDDLYDAAIEPSGIVEKKDSVDQSSLSESPKKETSTSSADPPPASTAAAQPPPTATPTATNSGTFTSNRRYQCYVGNLTWWTTDEDLAKAIEAYGVTDLIEIRFHENRQNGQSRGFATVAVASETSLRILMDKFPGRQLHGNAVAVLPFNKQALMRLEEANKGSAGPDDKNAMPSIGTVRIGPGGPMNMMNRPPMGPMNGMGGPGMMGMPFGGPPGMAARPLRLGQMNRPPPNFGGIGNGMGANQANSNSNSVQMLGNILRNQANAGGASNPQSLIPPGTHINPNRYPYFAQPTADSNRSGEVTPAEFNEIMERNRTVSSSAISRAMSDAAGGDVNSAIDTLQMAMQLIRQSRVGHTDACKALIGTLQEAMSSVESKREHGNSRKHRRRSRSPDRSSRKHRRGSRSRSRDRYDYFPASFLSSLLVRCWSSRRCSTADTQPTMRLHSTLHVPLPLPPSIHPLTLFSAFVLTFYCCR